MIMQFNKNVVIKFLNILQYFFVFMALSYFFVHLFAFFIFGEKSVISIHDNLDQVIPYFNMFKQLGILFAFDESTRGFDSMSSLFYGHMQYNFLTLSYYLFDDFVAYSVIYFSASIFAFIGMFVLLKRLAQDKFKDYLPIILVLSVFFAVLPVIPIWIFGVASLPWLLWAFLILDDSSTFKKSCFWLLFLPFFSEITASGFFVLGLWLIALVFVSINKRKINMNLVIGFVVLFLGYLLSNIKMVYAMLFINVPLTRDLLYSNLISKDLSLNQMWLDFIRIFENSEYHAPAFQSSFIYYVVFFSIALYVFLNSFQKKFDFSAQLHKKANSLMLLVSLYVFFVVLDVFYSNGFLVEFFGNLFSFLKGFNWGRAYVLNKVFALLMLFLSILVILTLFNRYKVLNLFVQTFFVGFGLFLINNVAISNVYYNDTFITIRTYIFNNSAKITYEEFFSKQTFDDLKNRINYKDENTVAFGFEPSVLMQNGFNTIDGYNNSYPLTYFYRFRKLIEPELDYDNKVKDYYDLWGGRMYLYRGLSSANPTFELYPDVFLRINPNTLKNDFKVKYLISRAKITNNTELNLKLIDTFEKKGSFYQLYTYKIMR